MALERTSASQVVTFAPQRPAWSFSAAGGGFADPDADADADTAYVVLTTAIPSSCGPGAR